MLICWPCAGSGNVFGGTRPLRWALCLPCRGTGFAKGKPIEPALIRMHKMPGKKKLRRTPNPGE